MSLRPAHVGAQQHCSPVARLSSSCAGLDGDDRICIGVLASKEERGARLLEADFKRRRSDLNFGEERLVALGACKLEEFTKIARRFGELLPEGELFTKALRLTCEASSDPLVIPEAGGEHLRLNCGESRSLCYRVKAPPTWLRSDRVGRVGQRRRRSLGTLTRSPEGDDGVLLLHARDRSRGYAP